MITYIILVLLHTIIVGFPLIIFLWGSSRRKNKPIMWNEVNFTLTLYFIAVAIVSYQTGMASIQTFNRLQEPTLNMEAIYDSEDR